MSPLPSRSLKRKHSKSNCSTTNVSHLDSNPRSHPPHVLCQFRVAGLPAEKPLPSDVIPNFPHRALKHGRVCGNALARLLDEQTDDADGGSESAESEDDEPIKNANENSTPITRARHTTATTAISSLATGIRRFLAVSDFPRAKAAFALLMRARVRGHPVDLRQDGFWALGADILMGEPDAAETRPDPTPRRTSLLQDQPSPAAVPSMARVARVRAYFSGLARRYPPVRHAPHLTNALDFWAAGYGYELAACVRWQRASLTDVGGGTEEEEAEEDGYDGSAVSRRIASDEYGNTLHDAFQHAEREDYPLDRRASSREYDYYETARKKSYAEQKNDVRRHALARAQDIAARMDALMDGLPYSRDVPLLRLRAGVALYMADLLKKGARQREDDEKNEENRFTAEDRCRERRRRQEEARRMLKRVLNAGEELVGGSLAGNPRGRTAERLLNKSVLDDVEGGGSNEEEEEEDTDEQNGGMVMFSSTKISD